MYGFNNRTSDKYFTYFYKTADYTGELLDSTDEGRVFRISLDDKEWAEPDANQLSVGLPAVPSEDQDGNDLPLRNGITGARAVSSKKMVGTYRVNVGWRWLVQAQNNFKILRSSWFAFIQSATLKSDRTNDRFVA